MWQNRLGRCMCETSLWEAREDHGVHQRESEFWGANWGQEEQIQESQILGDRRKRKEDPCLALSPLLGWKMFPLAWNLFPRDASETLRGCQDLSGEMSALYYNLFGQNLFPAGLRNLDNHRSTLSSIAMEADSSDHKSKSYHCYGKVSWQRLRCKSVYVTELHNNQFSYIYIYVCIYKTSKFLTCFSGLSVFSSTLTVWKISPNQSWAPEVAKIPNDITWQMQHKTFIQYLPDQIFFFFNGKHQLRVDVGYFSVFMIKIYQNITTYFIIKKIASWKHFWQGSTLEVNGNIRGTGVLE